MTKKRDIEALINDAIAIQEEELKKEDIRYIARLLAVVTMPHSRVGGNEYTRTNGNIRMTMLAPSHVGLPYGTIPRLLMVWLTTEATIKKERELVLGPTLSGFMNDLGLTPTGGRWGSIPRLRDQMRRLFACQITTTYFDEDEDHIRNFKVAKSADLWWSPKSPEQATLWKSTLMLSEEFFEEIINRPVPIDNRALRLIKRSPLKLDIYMWLTYRTSYLRKPTAPIPWVLLQRQLGAGYPENNQGKRVFKMKFIRALKEISLFYNPKVEISDAGLVLYPSKPHVPRLNKS